MAGVLDLGLAFWGPTPVLPLAGQDSVMTMPCSAQDYE